MTYIPPGSPGSSYWDATVRMPRSAEITTLPEVEDVDASTRRAVRGNTRNCSYTGDFSVFTRRSRIGFVADAGTTDTENPAGNHSKTPEDRIFHV